MQHELCIPESALAITTLYVRSLLAGDRSEALRVAVEFGLQRGVTVSELELRMILPAQRAAITAARGVAPDLPIAVGGGLLEGHPALAEELGVAVVGHDAEQLALACLRLLGCEPHDFASKL